MREDAVTLVISCGETLSLGHVIRGVQSFWLGSFFTLTESPFFAKEMRKK